MTTVILNNKGERLTMITCQYISGLYIAMYRENGSKIPEQTASKLKEKTFHKRLRKDFKWIPEESTIL